MDNKIIGGTVATTFPISLKEDTSKRVDAFGDVADKDKGKYYPSVFGVEAYGEELKAKIKEDYDMALDEIRGSVPKNLSDLEDDTVTYPVAISYSSFIADRADCDGNGKYIPDTYATKNENSQKLDKEPQMLKEDVLTEADVKLVAMTSEVEFTRLSEIIVSVYIPAITSDKYALQLKMIADESEATTDFINSNGRLFVPQNTNYGYFMLNANTFVVFNTNFYAEGSSIKTEMSNSQHGSNCYPDRPWIATGKSGSEITGKKGVAVKLITGAMGDTVSFPAGTTIKLYGR